MTWVRRLLLAVLVPLLTVPVVLTAAPGPAHACSCITGDPETFADSADAVFVGTVGTFDGPVDRDVTSAGGQAVTVAVERVYQGRVAADVTVTTGGPCGLGALRPGRSWLFYASVLDGVGADAGAYDVSLCSGSSPVRARTIAGVEAALGDGRPPTGPNGPTGPTGVPERTAEPAPLPRGTPTDADATGVRVDEDGTSTWWIVGGVVLLAAAGAAVVVRARAR